MRQSLKSGGLVGVPAIGFIPSAGAARFAIAYGKVDIIGHFVAGIGDKVLSPGMSASVEQENSETGCEGSGKGC